MRWFWKFELGLFEIYGFKELSQLGLFETLASTMRWCNEDLWWWIRDRLICAIQWEWIPPDKRIHQVLLNWGSEWRAVNAWCFVELDVERYGPPFVGYGLVSKHASVYDVSNSYSSFWWKLSRINRWFSRKWVFWGTRAAGARWDWQVPRKCSYKHVYIMLRTLHDGILTASTTSTRLKHCYRQNMLFEVTLQFITSCSRLEDP